MNFEDNFGLKMHPEYGAILTVNSEEMADDFDDFLTENYYVLYEIRTNNNSVDFLFGLASSKEQVDILVKAYKQLKS